jgi:hypothetical protein
VQLSAAAAFFGLDDRQKDVILGGYMMAAFFLIGAPSALVVRGTLGKGEGEGKGGGGRVVVQCGLFGQYMRESTAQPLGILRGLTDPTVSCKPNKLCICFLGAS